MSFWTTSDNESAATTGTSFETGGGQMEPIPSNTRLKAMAEDAKWDEDFQGNQIISVRWSVLAPDSYKNRKIFQKIRVMDPDTKKSDKAKRMLAAIDANCGGQLAKKEDVPTDMDLQSALLNKPVMIEVQVWEMEGDDGQTRSGNWVSRVAPANESAPAQKPAKDEDEDFPF